MTSEHISRPYLKPFNSSVSLLKKSKCLGLAKKNVSLTFSQSLIFISYHPIYDSQLSR